MANSLLFHALSIKDFDHISWDYSGKNTTTQTISRQHDQFHCAACDSKNVTPTSVGIRKFKCGKIGRDNWILKVVKHRVKCHDCGAFLTEAFSFIPSQKARITNTLARSIIELRSEMSINAIALHYDLEWHVIKNLEKEHLQKKYRSISLKNVQLIGIDEIYVGKKNYKTIVRDLESGAVLHVGDGKGGDALKDFEKKLHFSTAQISAIAIDMSSGYHAWAKRVLPETLVVFDHFHVIKLMNERINKIRRRTVLELEDKDLKTLKKTLSFIEKQRQSK